MRCEGYSCRDLGGKQKKLGKGDAKANTQREGKERSMEKKWKCVCGYIHDGAEAPSQCPKCGAPREKFTALDDAAAQLVERSRHNNALHCRLVSLAGKWSVCARTALRTI